MRPSMGIEGRAQMGCPRSYLSVADGWISAERWTLRALFTCTPHVKRSLPNSMVR